MATFNKFNSFVQALGEKKHDLANDQLVVALSNTLPVATNTVLANIDEIAYTNLSSRDLTTTSFTNTSGTSALVLATLVLEATGAVADFRYVIVYNDTATNDELIGWYDNGSVVSLGNGDKYNVVFTDSSQLLTIA